MGTGAWHADALAKHLECLALLLLEFFVAERRPRRRGSLCRGVDRQPDDRRIVGVHDVQRAAQAFAELRGGIHDAIVESGRLGVRMRRIDGGQHQRPVIGFAALEQQHGHGAEAQQLPVGEMQSQGRVRAPLWHSAMMSSAPIAAARRTTASCGG